MFSIYLICFSVMSWQTRCKFQHPSYRNRLNNKKNPRIQFFFIKNVKNSKTEMNEHSKTKY